MDRRPTSTISFDRSAGLTTMKTGKDPKKILVLTAFAVAIAVLICFCTVIIAEIVYKVAGEPEQKPNNSAGDIKYENAAFSSSDVNKGDLILVKEGFDYVDTSSADGRVEIRASKNDSYMVNSGVFVNASVMQSINAFLAAQKAATGCDDVQITSAYRTEQKQAENHEKWDDEPSKNASEHRIGNCFDVNLYDGEGTYELNDNEAVDTWMKANAHKYGFVDRYPDSKKDITDVEHDWTMTVRTTHFRYVGYAHAYYMYKNALCLEEYLELLSANYKYNGEHLRFVGDDGNSYEVYYVEAKGGETKVPVPTNYEYSVSGDNINGFIVTVYLSSPAN